jgi:hypothetical protein
MEEHTVVSELSVPHRHVKLWARSICEESYGKEGRETE